MHIVYKMNPVPLFFIFLALMKSRPLVARKTASGLQSADVCLAGGNMGML